MAADINTHFREKYGTVRVFAWDAGDKDAATTLTEGWELVGETWEEGEGRTWSERMRGRTTTMGLFRKRESNV